MFGLALLVSVAQAAILQYDFNITYQNDVPEYLHKPRLITVNDQFPGPLLEGNVGDTFNIKVTNQLQEETSIHFHGLFQKGSQHMDGVEHVTQLPIRPGESYWYNFTVEQSGTCWYHSHDHIQYGDGLRGGIVIHGTSNVDFDEEVFLTMTDWYPDHASGDILADLMKPGRGADPRVTMGLFNDTNDFQWHVQPEKTYLVRLVNVAVSSTQTVEFKDHPVTIVEVDGVAVEPYDTERVQLATGQRLAFLLKTKSDTLVNFPIYHYVNKMMGYVKNSGWIMYNEQTVAQVNVPELPKSWVFEDRELHPLEGEFLEDPQHRIILDYAMINSDEYNTRMFTINDVIYTDPTDDVLLYNVSGEYKIKSGDVVELVINAKEHMRHPWHLHGHNFQVVSRGKRDAGFYYATGGDIDDMVASDIAEIKNNGVVPVTRDTVMIQGNSYIVLRFKADNPGCWILHCHVDWHMAKGLAVVLVEGEEELKDQYANFRVDPFNEKLAGENPEHTRTVQTYTGTRDDTATHVPEPTYSEPADTTPEDPKEDDSAMDHHSVMTPTTPFSVKLKVLIVYLCIMVAFAAMVYYLTFIRQRTYQIDMEMDDLSFDTRASANN